MVRQPTSVRLDEWVISQLKHMDVNVSDITNTLLEGWLKYLKDEGPVLQKAVARAVIIHKLKEYVDEVCRAL